MKTAEEQELKNEIRHIFDSGANNIRIFEMVKTFIDRRYQQQPSRELLKKAFRAGSAWADDWDVGDDFVPTEPNFEEWYNRLVSELSEGEEEKVSALAFVESCADMTEYVAGKKIAHRFRKYTIPVIEYNELRQAAKDFDNEQNQPEHPDNSLRELEKILNDYLTDEEIKEIGDALKALRKSVKPTSEWNDFLDSIKDYEIISDEEIEQVACDEMQQDWNDLAYQKVYKDGFVDGAEWMRDKLIK